MRAQVPFVLRGKRVCLAGYHGALGIALYRRLVLERVHSIKSLASESDLRDPGKLYDWLDRTRPQIVFLSEFLMGQVAGQSGHQARSHFDNLKCTKALFQAAQRFNVEKLVFVGLSKHTTGKQGAMTCEPARSSSSMHAPSSWRMAVNFVGFNNAMARRRSFGSDHICVSLGDLQNDTIAGPDGENLEFEGLALVEAADGIVYLAEHYTGEDIVHLSSGSGSGGAARAMRFARAFQQRRKVCRGLVPVPTINAGDALDPMSSGLGWIAHKHQPNNSLIACGHSAPATAMLPPMTETDLAGLGSTFAGARA